MAVPSLRDRVASPELIEQEYLAAKKQERANRRALREWYKRNGLEDLRLKAKKAREVEEDALYALMDVRPTTAAGAGALITYVRRDMKEGQQRGILQLLPMPPEPFSQCRVRLFLYLSRSEKTST